MLALALPLNLIILGAIWGLINQADDAQRTSLLYAARSIAAAVDAKLGKCIALVGTETDHVAPWRSVYKLNLTMDTEMTHQRRP